MTNYVMNTAFLYYQGSNVKEVTMGWTFKSEVKKFAQTFGLEIFFYKMSSGKKEKDRELRHCIVFQRYQVRFSEVSSLANRLGLAGTVPKLNPLYTFPDGQYLGQKSPGM